MPRVSTIAIIALDEFSHVVNSTGGPVMAATLAEHPEWIDLGMRVAAIAERAPEIELLPGLGMAGGEISFIWINPFGRIACVKWSHDYTVDELASTNWAAHWRYSWKAVTDAWPSMASAHKLPKQDWLFAFTVVEGTTSEMQGPTAVARTLPGATARMDADGMSIGLGWNGALIVRAVDSCETDVDAILAIATIMSLRWQVETHALRRIRKLLGNDQRRENRDTQTANIVAIARHVYNAQTTLEPSVFCIYGSDDLVARSFDEGWGAEKLSERVSAAIQRMSEANELDTRIQLRQSGHSQARSLFLLTMIGVCGTMAGVLSAVDFRNAIFSSETMRVIMLTSGTMVLAAVAILAQRSRTSS